MTVSSWVRASLVLVAVFVAGALAGIGYERSKAVARPVVDHTAPHGLGIDLGLDSAQQVAVAQILARHQKAIDATWHSLQPHVRATLDSTHQEILGVLRPDQAEKYRQRMRTMHPARNH